MTGKKKKKKVRVAFRKNRQRPARRNNLTREALDEQFLDDPNGVEDLATDERLSGKGQLTRYRTVIGEELTAADGGVEVLIDVDESKCRIGRVISAAGLNSIVQDERGQRFECTVRRVVRTMSRDARNAVVAGDEVLFQPLDENYGVIERVNPRRGVLSRSSRRREHIIVANIDQVLIVVSAAEPALKINLIDRFIVSAEKGGVDAVICINKIDLVDSVNLQPIVGLYGRLGYRIVMTSVEESTGIEELRQFLAGRETVLAGQSGVGKTSLLNALQPEFNLQTAEVSTWTQKGRHTTRRAVLRQLDFGGWVVDTPGVRQMALWDVIPEEVEGFFVEFRSFVPRCKFPDCSHSHEDNCGVKNAVEAEMIAECRYLSYLKMISDD